MEIFLEKRAVKSIRLAATDAVEEGETDLLRDAVNDAFTDEQIEEIERRIDSGDLYEFISEIIDEWSGDDVDELLELLETHLAEAGVDIKYSTGDADNEGDDEKEAEDDADDEPDGEEEDLGVVEGESEEEEDVR